MYSIYYKIIICKPAALAVDQVWRKWSMVLERDINVMLSRLAPLIFLCLLFFSCLLLG